MGKKRTPIEAQRSGFDWKRRKNGALRALAEAKGNGARFLPTTWPVGQVVKTAASHAVNIGSNPVRVTTSKQAADHSLPHECESSIPPLLFLSDF